MFWSICFTGKGLIPAHLLYILTHWTFSSDYTFFPQHLIAYNGIIGLLPWPHITITWSSLNLPMPRWQMCRISDSMAQTSVFFLSASVDSYTQWRMKTMHIEERAPALESDTIGSTIALPERPRTEVSEPQFIMWKWEKGEMTTSQNCCEVTRSLKLPILVEAQKMISVIVYILTFSVYSFPECDCVWGRCK